ncbi:nucleotidyltransferase domain-containing protein [bacterium]|nr:nucleotidyltransferase domain-containing protein [bacterium]
MKRYLAGLPQYGIHPRRAILYGSFARGEERQYSDIDLIVIAPEFDEAPDMETEKKLWVATGGVDDRIEPIGCGVEEWERDTWVPILQIARQEGIEIAA